MKNSLTWHDGMYFFFKLFPVYNLAVNVWTESLTMILLSFEKNARKDIRFGETFFPAFCFAQ